MLALGGAATSSAKPAAGGPPDTYVTSWDAVGTQAFSAAALTPAEGHVIFAYVAIAVYDSVMAIKGGYEPFAVDVDAPPNTRPRPRSPRRRTACSRTTCPRRRRRSSILRTPRPSATIPDGPAKTNGFASAKPSPDLAHRPALGRRLPGADAAYVPPNPPVPGVWVPTAATPPIGPYLGPCDRSPRFRGPVPARAGRLPSTRRSGPTSTTRSRRSARPRSTTRTPEQTDAARFWAEAPVQQARGSFRKFVLDHQLDVADAARFMAMMSVTYADGLIACFDAKYLYVFWRPITAIRAGDTDGNDATVGDPGWTPLLPATPNHPEYPSAHSCITPAAGTRDRAFPGDAKIDFTIPSLAGPRRPDFDDARALEYEVSNARIWGGIHFRSAVEEGAKIASRPRTTFSRTTSRTSTTDERSDRRERPATAGLLSRLGGLARRAGEVRLQAQDRLRVELRHARLGDAEHLADLAQGQLLVVVESHDELLALGQLRDRLGERLASPRSARARSPGRGPTRPRSCR